MLPGGIDIAVPKDRRYQIDIAGFPVKAGAVGAPKLMGDEKWAKIIGGMTIYTDIELKAYLEQAGFHEVQIHKKKGWLCVSAQK